MKIFKFLKRTTKYFGFQILAMGIVAGFANTVLIAIINESLVQEDTNSNFFLMLIGGFVIAMAVYFLIQSFYQGRLIRISESLLWNIRNKVLDHVRKSNYAEYEKFGKNKIYSSLSRDAEMISNMATSLTYATTASLTVVGTLVYLAWLTPIGFGIMLGVMILAIGYFMLRQKKLTSHIRTAREHESDFFKYVEHVLDGIKEIKVDEDKNDDLFLNHVTASGQKAEKFRVKSAKAFMNDALIGQFSFFLIVGVVLYALPFMNVKVMDNTSQYILVVLYLLGPIQNLVQLFPTFAQASVAVGKITELEKKVAMLEEVPMESTHTTLDEEMRSIGFKGLSFGYKDKDGNDTFKVGPINRDFSAGEITFISGGNGSGKSTLVKLLSGLYSPTEGNLTINGTKLDESDLQIYRNQISIVYTDNFLFDKHYGSTPFDEKLVHELIHRFELQEKVELKDGYFSTVSLSQGQRKRLALIAALAENKPVHIYDEWAANQDPEFKDVFYHQILPSLRDQGKVVIVITHDDKYFDLADNLLRMEHGKLTEAALHV